MTSSAAQNTLPTSAKARYLAPDVARGLALLGIILANITSFWLADWSIEHAAYFGGYTGTPTALEQVAIIFQGMFVHVRGLPMFATLLGVGIAMIVQGQLSRGSATNNIRRLLLRRYGWLIVFGVVHSVVLFPGDILTTYGVLALIMVPLITCSDQLLKGVAAVLVAIHAAMLSVAVFIELGAEPTDPGKVSAGLDNSVSDSFSEFGSRLVDALFTVIFSPLSAPKLLPLVIVGFLWGRAGVFGDIETHRLMLSRWAFGAAAVIVVAGLPWGLAGAGIFPEGWVFYFSLANELLSIVVGPGIDRKSVV